MVMGNDKPRLKTEPPLVVYKASAGSGKTFTLTLYYLWLLFSKSQFDTFDSERNKTYRHILAVTFTNKATGEMKARIIKSLYNLAIGSVDHNSRIYREELIGSGCVKDEEELQKRSMEILYTLLHDYTNFNVSTIDTFFQKTMRAFVRDIGMQGGYNVELDSENIANEAIDRMYLSLSDDTDDDTLKKWLLDFDISQIEEKGEWNSAERKIRVLSKELFKEEYKRWRDNLPPDKTPSKDDVAEFNKFITSKSHALQDKWKNIVKGGSEILEDIDTDQLAGMGKTVLKYFISPAEMVTLPPKSLLSSDRTKWEHKKNVVYQNTKDLLDKFDSSGYLDELRDFYQNDYPQYCLYEILRHNLYSFGILSDVDIHMRDIIKERNIMLLSDTTDLLNKVIKGTDTPFIYEKVGVNIHHYMIDEFQDTSHAQWENFLPLLKESISKGGHNLIVGDVKQSIYRWRNSDWTMLNGLPESEELFMRNGAEKETMDVNWRSAPNVVNFNNEFFTHAVDILLNSKISEYSSYIDGLKEFPLEDKIKTAYQDCEQKQNDKKETDTGYVKVEFVTPEIDYKKEVLAKLYSDIQTMLKRGYSADKIAILTRTNSDAILTAQYLMSEQKDEGEKFYVISNEALMIKNSSSVKSIIAIMRYINSSKEPINRLMMNYEYATSISTASPNLIESAIKLLEENSLEYDEVIEQLSSKSLFEICEGIIELLNIKDDEDQLPYIQAFQDVILSYSGQRGNALLEFLDWWDLHSKDFCISTPETKNAVRIITIHKSKGLEYPTIFIPFCDWKIEQGETILWREYEEEGSRSWMFPLSVSKKMLESPYINDYLEEKSLSVIDNLNIGYVAFTRAEDNLIVYAKKQQRPKSMSSFNALLYATIESMVNKIEGAKFENDIYVYGKMYIPQRGEEEDENTVKEISRYKVAPIESKLRLKLKGEAYFDNHSNLSIGKVKHKMMSEVIFKEDVERVAMKYERMGVLSSTEKSEFINEILSQIEGNPQIAEWFDKGNYVLNETAVLNPSSDGKLNYRPDRLIIKGDKVVIVDYKFGKESSSNIKQMKDYISILKQMGNFDVSGYIWYVTERRVI